MEESLIFLSKVEDDQQQSADLNIKAPNGPYSSLMPLLYHKPTYNKFERDNIEFYHILNNVDPCLKFKNKQSPCNVSLIAGGSDVLVVMVERDLNQQGNSNPTSNTECGLPYMLFKWHHVRDSMPNFKRLDGMEKLIQKDYQMVDGKTFNMVVSMVCFESNIVYLTHDGRVFSDWNCFKSTPKIKDKHGALIGCIVGIDLSLYHAEKIAAGTAHVLVLLRERLTGKRKVFGFGSSRSHQLAVNSHQITELEPIEILSKSSKDQVIDIKCGGNFSVFLTLQGYLYVCGDNTFQQTGKKKQYICIMDVMKVTLKEFNYDLEKIREVSCGENFTVVITNKGRVFSTIQNIGIRKLSKQEEIGFFEIDYFSNANIQVRHAYITSNAIILQSKNQLYYFKVKNEIGNSLIGRIVIVNEIPKPILFESLKQHALHVFTSNTNPYIFVKRIGMNGQLVDFFDKLHQTELDNKFSDLTIL